jgi:hypothetical protein
MGGQVDASGQTSYTSGAAAVKTAAIFIDSRTAVPVYIETHPSGTNAVQSTASWRFDPLFFEVDGGFAPRSFDFDSSAVFRERQEFQVAGNVWIFKRGDGWRSLTSNYLPGEHIQTIEVINLRLGMALVAKRADKPIQFYRLRK